MSRRRFVLAAAAATSLLPVGTHRASAETAATESELLGRAHQLFDPQSAERTDALAWIAERGKPDMAIAVIEAMRFFSRERLAQNDVLRTVTGHDAKDWHGWMLWVEANPQVESFPGYDGFKADIFAQIDGSFRSFLYAGMAHEIRLEEIAWGGVVKDGIPALTNPDLIAAHEADYLTEEELVFGVEIGGDARAYPLRIMDWHEMFNDVIGGRPVSLAYCTLCGSGILYDTAAADGNAPFVFGSSGFLYRSNKLMFDRETESLWNQFAGRPVTGDLTGSGIVLPVLPVTISSWAKWRDRHPATRVLSKETGYLRDYRPGAPYGDYFASTELMFPALVNDDRLAAKDYVFALRLPDGIKAWPLARFDGGAAINDKIGNRAIVLVGDAAARTVRAYDADGMTFSLAPDPDSDALLDEAGGRWIEAEDALISSDGSRLARLPGHIAYWFAWQSYFPDAPVATEPDG